MKEYKVKIEAHAKMSDTETVEAKTKKQALNIVKRMMEAQMRDNPNDEITITSIKYTLVE